MRAFPALAALIAAGCSTLPAERIASCDEARRPEIRLSEDGRTASARISVLTYNVEGLSWPARTGRGEQLREIAARLDAMRAAGMGPDIVHLQEVFSRAASRAMGGTGYPNLVAGPARAEAQPPRNGPSLPGRRRPHRGEIGMKFVGGGLIILSGFRVIDRNSRPFPKGSCAGRDCLANKGMLHARVVIPGVPGALDLFNTHMNSQRASRVPLRRHLASHHAQTRALTEYLAEMEDPAMPLIFGGDFNMRHSEPRFAEFQRLQPLKLVHEVCSDPDSGCEVLMSWDGDEPWMDTQDLQLFQSGSLVTIRPVRVEAMFDGGESGPQLSDHDGFLVTYELSWPAQDERVPVPICPAVSR
jgi:endonuclease/exonuclease/phosphatase family metal-dependent hydrolase